jgi:ribosomal-protein-alanine N-acetyltransferase
VSVSRPEEAPTIETKRLWLTAFTQADAEAVFAYASDPEVSRHTTWTPHRSIEDARAFITYARGEEYCWAIRRAREGPAIGAIESSVESEGLASIHFVLAREEWGQGIMTEAAKAVLTWSFARYPSLALVRTAAVADNVASRRVMEKCGMVFERFATESWAKCEVPVRLAVYRVTREAFGRRGS